MTGVRSCREAWPGPGSLHVAGGDAAARPQHAVALLQGAPRPDADAAAPHRPYRCQCRPGGPGLASMQHTHDAVWLQRLLTRTDRSRKRPTRHWCNPVQPRLPKELADPGPCVGGWARRWPASRPERYTNLTDCSRPARVASFRPHLVRNAGRLITAVDVTADADDQSAPRSRLPRLNSRRHDRCGRRPFGAQPRRVRRPATRC